MEQVPFHILVLVVEGSVHYSVDGTDYVGEEGHFLFIPQGSLRSGQNARAGTHRKYTILFRTDPQLASGIPFLDERRFIKFKISNFQYIAGRCGRLFEAARGGNRYRFIIGMGIMQELLGMLAEELEKPELTPMKLLLARTIHDYLLSHYREPLQIAQIAALINRTPGYATHLFKEAYGLSPIKYMHDLRMAEARKLLLQSDMTVADIAFYLGYYDSSYFFKMFKKAVGMSPTAFSCAGQSH